MATSAMFEGLVFDQVGQAAQVAYVGVRACYTVYDDDFKMHIDAAKVDRQVLVFMRQQVENNRDLAVKSALELMGKDDLFTKVAIESSIDNMENAVGSAIPHDARQWLGMLGFRIVIDTQGNVLAIDLPAGGEEGDE